MDSIDCMLKLSGDADFKNATRIVEMSVNKGGASLRRGTWTMISDATDSRMRIGETQGSWAVHHSDDHGWVMYFIGSGDIILLELYHVGSHPLETISCGSSRGGDGWRQGPPNADVEYVFSVGCV